MAELIVLLDDAGNEIGSAPKLESHHANTPLHLAFSCYVFDDAGKFLVTRRALSKKVWPGVWTNSFCGHPAPGEAIENAIHRRAQDELGMQVADIQLILPDYRYTTPPYSGVIENEICPVYAAHAASEVIPNSQEVEEYRWLAWNEYARELNERAEEYSYWAKDQFSRLIEHEEFRRYITRL